MDAFFKYNDLNSKMKNFCSEIVIRERDDLLDSVNKFYEQIIDPEDFKLAEKPLVSVVMPAFNAQATIRKSVESILSQTYDNFELIIVNDGSTDNTEDIIKKYAEQDKRIKYVYQENRGVSRAFNRGIEEASGKYIYFLASDDFAFRDSLRILTYASENSPENTKLICGNYFVFFEQSKAFKDNFVVTPPDKKQLYIYQLISNIIPANSVMIERTVLLEFGGFDENFSCAVDYDLWNRIITKYDFFRVPFPIYLYSVYDSGHQVSGDPELLRLFSDIACQRLLDYLIRSRKFNDLRPELPQLEFYDLLSKEMLKRSDPGIESSVTVLKNALNTPYRKQIESVIEATYLMANSNILNHFQNKLRFDSVNIDSPEKFSALYLKKMRRKISYVMYFKNKKNYYYEADYYLNIQFTYNDKRIILFDWLSDFLPSVIANVLNMYDQLWVSSQTVKNNYMEAGLQENKIKVLPALIDEQFYDNKGQKLNIDAARSFNFLYFDSISTSKGVDILIEAFQEEFSEDEDVSLLIKNELAFNFQKWKKISNISKNNKNIIFLEKQVHQADILSLYKSSHCLVSPFLYKVHFNRFWEAMAAGLPVISTNNPAEDFSDFDNVFMISSDLKNQSSLSCPALDLKKDISVFCPDKEDLKKQMRYVYSNYSEIKKNSIKNQSSVLNTYSHAGFLDKVRAYLT